MGTIPSSAASRGRCNRTAAYSVAIGHSLTAHLHQPDHGDERPEEPEPADERIVPFRNDDRGRDRQQQQDGSGHLEDRKRCASQGGEERVGREERQVVGPECLSQVARVGVRGVRKSLGHREDVEAHQRALATLDRSRDGARRGR
jgi:hypothetical protein